MKFHLKPTDPGKLETDVLVCFCWENELKNQLGLPSDLWKIISEIAQKENFTGKESQLISVYPQGIISAFKFILYGLGKKDDFDLFRLYKSVSSAVKKVMAAKEQCRMSHMAQILILVIQFITMAGYQLEELLPERLSGQLYMP